MLETINENNQDQDGEVEPDTVKELVTWLGLIISLRKRNYNID